MVVKVQILVMLTDEQNAKKRMIEQNNAKFESNLAVVMIYLSTKFYFDRTNRFLVKSPETTNVCDYVDE